MIGTRFLKGFFKGFFELKSELKSYNKGSMRLVPETIDLGLGV